MRACCRGTTIGDSRRRSGKPYAAVLAALTALFALRVAGQAMQQWLSVAWLPPFHAFQGSNVSYPVLLASQLAILAAMVLPIATIAREPKPPNRRLGLFLACVGGVYMTGSVVRIVLGLTAASQVGWFTAWIPAAFHLVLAGYILTLAAWHRRRE